MQVAVETVGKTNCWDFGWNTRKECKSSQVVSLFCSSYFSQNPNLSLTLAIRISLVASQPHSQYAISPRFFSKVHRLHNKLHYLFMDDIVKYRKDKKKVKHVQTLRK